MAAYEPSAISFIAEQRIREAQERGEFDNLPGSGKALHLEDDSFVPADLRMAYKILRNAGYVPPEVTDRKELNNILELLEQCTDAQQRVRYMQKLEVLQRKIAAQRHSPMHLEDHDAYYQRIVEKLAQSDQNTKK